MANRHVAGRLTTIAAVSFGFAAVTSPSLAQSWQALNTQPGFQADTPLLLTDGTVMVHELGSTAWWRLTPDAFGSYVNGTWSPLAGLPNGYIPLYYASAVLPDGRVIVEGGEDTWVGGKYLATDTTQGAIYDPVANAWTSVAPPSGWTSIGDATSTVLADGTFMLADCCTAGEALLDPATLTWTATGTGKAGTNNEEGWTLLPDDSVLTIDVAHVVKATERYIGGAWHAAAKTSVNLVAFDEIGPAVLRPDGTVFATGANGYTSIYHPPTSAKSLGSWTNGPKFPKVLSVGQFDVADGPAALLPSGNVLVAASPGTYRKPVHFYEFNGTTLTQVPDTPNAPNIPSYDGRMLPLPTGQVLLTDTSGDVEIYTSTGAPQAAWAPTIGAVPTTLTQGASYVVSGTLFNGLSQAAAYGDDYQAATNYPLVRITNGVTGHGFFAPTVNPSSMGVGNQGTVSTTFTIPAGIETGASSLVVIANGIPSPSVAVTLQ